MSPVRSHPSARGPRASLLVLVVPLEHGRAAEEELAVVGEAQLHSGSARPDRSESEMRGRVHGRRGGAFGQPVTLEDQDVERVEELDDLARERRAAGDTQPDAAAEPLVHLR